MFSQTQTGAEWRTLLFSLETDFQSYRKELCKFCMSSFLYENLNTRATSANTKFLRILIPFYSHHRNERNVTLCFISITGPPEKPSCYQLKKFWNMFSFLLRGKASRVQSGQSCQLWAQQVYHSPGVSISLWVPSLGLTFTVCDAGSSSNQQLLQFLREALAPENYSLNIFKMLLKLHFKCMFFSFFLISIYLEERESEQVSEQEEDLGVPSPNGWIRQS